ncbi:MAG: hypothetical protein EXQ86_11095 [Rhodospirillales bacterium]|nr:hypothetical protein [Rhodospirillales bacterium]
MTYAAKLADDGLCIFLFHGVVERSPYQVRNYTRKHLEKNAFARVLRSLQARGVPVSLELVIQHHQTGTPLPPRAFAITFDDGFENNLTVAAPVLDDFGIPATFYMTTDFIERNRMSWTDRIEWAIEQVSAATLRLPWGTRAFKTAAEARAVLDEIRGHAKQDRSIDPNVLATDIQRQLGFPETWSSDDPLDRKLDWRQVKQLAADPLFTVGGHSHSHAILSFLAPEALDREIDESCRLLDEKAGLAPRHYSYPEGLAHCYSDLVIARLKAKGVVCCPTAEPGLNDHRTDLFRLLRINVD